MTQRPVTLIVSDLHMGGGDADRGDDFVHQGKAFDRFLDGQLQSPDGRAGQIELILNGDTFELAQVRPELYTLRSAEFWCSRDESLAKLHYVLDGHDGIFDRLRDFIAAGNVVTMAAGNHDVELYWPEVRSALEARIGPIGFELGQEWFTRYGDRLAIAHGHMLDPANRFVHWADPVLAGPDGERLEMCPGTLFMVKLVNILERDFPFADNLHPVTSLARILAKDQRSGLAGAAWLLAKFVAQEPTAFLQTGQQAIDYDVRLQRALLDDPVRFDGFAAAWREAVDANATDAALRARLAGPDGVVPPFLELLARLPLARWLPLADLPPTSLSFGSDAESGSDGTLSILKSGWQEADQVLRFSAQDRMTEGTKVVVMGHTHQPDVLETPVGVYFNPGSWTRYVDTATIGLLTIEDLKNEENFPYQLNYVRVEENSPTQLTARMTTFEERRGFVYGQRLNLSSR
jgi:UDP-2,3-diacylglucosamine pyrophosphatase LpxH